MDILPEDKIGAKLKKNFCGSENGCSNKERQMFHETRHEAHFGSEDGCLQEGAFRERGRRKNS